MPEHPRTPGSAIAEGIHSLLRKQGSPGKNEIAALAAGLNIPAARLRGVASFYSDFSTSPATLTCDGTSCHLCGAGELGKRLEEEGTECRSVYCLGYCHQSPVALAADGVLLHHGSGSRPEIRCHGSTPIVTRRLLAGGAAALGEATAQGAYKAFAAALQGPSERILTAMERSGERGRGGAAFATARKWRACAEAPAERRYVIANGDEGDPGSFIDRLLMEEDPHAILEGMLLCGLATGADEGMVFIRSEYPRAISAMRSAIREARKAGWMGKNIGGSGFNFDISVFPGLGSYVCGEETALLNAIEGRRGEVRIRPPLPVHQGLYGYPTVINNVETLANVPFIVADGGRSYATMGSAASTGTKALCLNRGFARPGIVEVEFGISLRTVIEELGGGSRDGRPLAAVLLGGPMGSVVTPAAWDVPVCYTAMRELGIELGHGGMVAVPEDADFRGLLDHWIRFMIDESCGKCVPCRLGSQCAANALTANTPEVETRRRLEELFTAMEQGSLCAFGQNIPIPMRQLIRHFGDRIFDSSHPPHQS